jgi:branched-chain amino acid transport system substrate-binding protein
LSAIDCSGLLATIFAAMVAIIGAPPALAGIPDRTIKVGVLSDFSGPFADQVGKGSLVGAQIAAEDFAREAGDLKIEIVYADHQNKPDVGLSIVRRWIEEERVSAVADLANSGVGLPVSAYLHDKNRTMLASSTATSDLTGKSCQPTTVQWTLDSWALGSVVGRTITRMGGKTWYFISFEYALGKALQRDATEAIVKTGGAIVGSVSHPLGVADFGSYLLQAQASGLRSSACGHWRRCHQRDPPGRRLSRLGRRSATCCALPTNHRHRCPGLGKRSRTNLVRGVLLGPKLRLVAPLHARVRQAIARG